MPGMQGSFHTQTGGPAYPHPQLSRPACPLASRAPLAGFAFQPSESTAKGPPPPFYTANPNSFTIQMGGGEGGGCRGGRGPPVPEIGREGLSIPRSEKGGALLSNPGLWSLSELGGGPGSIICPRLPSPKSDPIPAPSQAAAVSAGLG